MPEETYLERTLYRLRAQYATLALAVDRLPVKNGIVWEIGLGKGRSYDHLRRLLPEADIFAFDREVVSVPDCTPPADRLIVGELSETLPQMAARHENAVTLVHVDVGPEPLRSSTREALERAIARVLAPGGFAASGSPLSLPDSVASPLEAGAIAGGYILWGRIR
jgi:hypothetical protein